MATLTLKFKRPQLNRIFDMDQAIDVVKETLIKQRRERFVSEGTSDGGTPWPKHRHDPGKNVLTGGGQLRDLVEFEVERRPQGFTVTMFSAPGMELVSNVHQFGTTIGKDIVPKTARALFIPTSGRGRRSFLRVSPGGKRVRIGTKGNRRGLAPTEVSLKPSKPGGSSGGDFVLVNRIPATPEKDNRAIQQRQHFRVTPQNADELIENILGSQTRR